MARDRGGGVAFFHDRLIWAAEGRSRAGGPLRDNHATNTNEKSWLKALRETTYLLSFSFFLINLFIFGWVGSLLLCTGFL